MGTFGSVLSENSEATSAKTLDMVRLGRVRVRVRVRVQGLGSGLGLGLDLSEDLEHATRTHGVAEEAHQHVPAAAAVHECLGLVDIL